MKRLRFNAPLRTAPQRNAAQRTVSLRCATPRDATRRFASQRNVLPLGAGRESRAESRRNEVDR